MNVEERLFRLERSNRRMKLINGALLTLLATGLLMGASYETVQQVVKTKRLEVLDTQGKVVAVIGEVPLSTTTASDDKAHGFVLMSGDGKQVARLAMRKSSNSNAVGYAGLEVFDPEGGKKLLFAGAGVASGGIGRLARINLDDRQGVFGFDIMPNSLGISVKIREGESAQAVSLYAKQDHSAKLSLGGMFEPFGAEIVAEGKSPRLEIAKGTQTKTFGFQE
jgi:hypothetical protein